jgi:diadenosine tetraphosphate (Ap4A) HIT family hydrolase
MHVHFHVLPRTGEDDLFRAPRSRGKIDDAEAKELVEAASKAFAAS